MGRLMMAFGGLFIPAARESLEMMYELKNPSWLMTANSSGFGNHATPLKDAIHQTSSGTASTPAPEHPRIILLGEVIANS